MPGTALARVAALAGGARLLRRLSRAALSRRGSLEQPEGRTAQACLPGPPLSHIRLAGAALSRTPLLSQSGLAPTAWAGACLPGTTLAEAIRVKAGRRWSRHAALPETRLRLPPATALAEAALPRAAALAAAGLHLSRTAARRETALALTGTALPRTAPLAGTAPAETSLPLPWAALTKGPLAAAPLRRGSPPGTTLTARAHEGLGPPLTLSPLPTKRLAPNALTAGAHEALRPPLPLTSRPHAARGGTARPLARAPARRTSASGTGPPRALGVQHAGEGKRHDQGAGETPRCHLPHGMSPFEKCCGMGIGKPFAFHFNASQPSLRIDEGTDFVPF